MSQQKYIDCQHHALSLTYIGLTFIIWLFPYLSSCTAKVCLTSTDLRHTHLAQAGDLVVNVVDIHNQVEINHYTCDDIRSIFSIYLIVLLQWLEPSVMLAHRLRT